MSSLTWILFSGNLKVSQRVLDLDALSLNIGQILKENTSVEQLVSGGLLKFGNLNLQADKVLKTNLASLGAISGVEKNQFERELFTSQVLNLPLPL